MPFDELITLSRSADSGVAEVMGSIAQEMEQNSKSMDSRFDHMDVS